MKSLATLVWARTNSSNHAIRYIFDGDHLYISGDVGNSILIEKDPDTFSMMERRLKIFAQNSLLHSRSLLDTLAALRYFARGSLNSGILRRRLISYSCFAYNKCKQREGVSVNCLILRKSMRRKCCDYLS